MLLKINFEGLKYIVLFFLLNHILMRVQYFYLVNIQLGAFLQFFVFFFLVGKFAQKKYFLITKLVTLKYLADYISLLFELVLQKTSIVHH